MAGACGASEENISLQKELRENKMFIVYVQSFRTYCFNIPYLTCLKVKALKNHY